MYCVYWIRLPEHISIWTQGYVGVSKDAKRRLIEHKSYMKNAHLANAMRKYGDDVFLELVTVGTQDECLQLERILRHKENIGWNIAKGGGIPPSPLGRKISNRYRPKGISHSEETKQKISAKLKGRKVPADVIAKRSATRTGKKRKPFTEAHRKAMSEAAKRRHAR